MFPCNDCAKLIIQSGIKKVIYMCDKYHETKEFQASQILLTLANVEIEKFVPKQKKITIDFEALINASSNKNIKS
jgi:dCMP deaminase